MMTKMIWMSKLQRQLTVWYICLQSRPVDPGVVSQSVATLKQRNDDLDDLDDQDNQDDVDDRDNLDDHDDLDDLDELHDQMTVSFAGRRQLTVWYIYYVSSKPTHLSIRPVAHFPNKSSHLQYSW